LNSNVQHPESSKAQAPNVQTRFRGCNAKDQMKRRGFLKTAASSVAFLAAAGCDQVPKELRALFPPQGRAIGRFQAPSAEAIDPIAHALNRTAFGPRPG